MRILLLITVVFTVSAFAQTRVKENIKQQSLISSEDGSTKVVKKGKRVKQ